MGLGKTAVCLRALTPEHLPALVTAPPRVAKNVWPKEASIWRPDLSVGLAEGHRGKRYDVLTAPHDIHVISREVLQQTLEHGGPWKTLIIDELSGFKSRGSVRWKSARKIIKQHGIEHVWGLTGTPASNGLLDLWAQVALLDGGERLGKTLTGFRNRYFYPANQIAGGIITSWEPRPGADAAIHRKIDDICISMSTEGRVELPDLIHNIVEVPLPPKVRAIYKRFKADLVADLEMIGGEVHTAMTAATLSNKLRQVTAGFMYVDDADLRNGQYDSIHSEKVSALQEIIDGTGSPILVFYQYRAEKEAILKALKGQAHTIDEPDIVDRWNAGEVPVLVAHPASAGHGLNLQQGGHTIVWTSLTWSLEEWEQANKRLHRSGQKNTVVVVHSLISPRTIDGAIRDRLILKKTVQDALLEHLESPL